MPALVPPRLRTLPAWRGYRGRVRRSSVHAAVFVGVALLSGCAAEPSCDPAPASETCADVLFHGVPYNEWGEIEPEPWMDMQELGDATYPDCNVPDGCPGSELDGHGATGAYLLDGVDPADAFIGERQNSDVRVIFLRVGADPDDLALPE
jgi:hypothetical protein